MEVSPDEARRAIEYVADTPRRAAECLTIRNKAGKTVPLVYSPAQKKLSALWRKMEMQNRPVRIIALKPRQVHMSVGVAAEMFLRIPFFAGQQGVVMANDDDTSGVLFDYYKQFQESYKFSPLALGNDLLPGLLKDTDRHFRWANDSAIECRTAGATAGGRGRSRRFLHLSEYGFWPDAEKVMRGIMASLPEDPGTAAIIESTANGLGGSFWERWQQAVAGVSGWEPLFFAWWEHPEYSRALDVSASQFQNSLNDDEINIWRQYGLTLEQLYWRRDAIKSKFGGSLDGFKQEYPSNPEEAFLMSGRPRFNIQSIARQQVIREPMQGKLRTTMVGTRERVMFEPDAAGELQIFKMPADNKRYVIGADPAKGKDQEKGKSDPDYSVATVMDIDTGEQVASLRERLTPFFFAEYLKVLGRFYNLAYLVPEANELGFIEALLSNEPAYPPGRFFERKPDPDNLRPPTAHEIGWYESVTTRPMLISVLESALLDGSIHVRKANTVSELMSFVVKPNGRAEHQQGCHDDEVFALGLAVMGIQAVPRRAPEHKFKLESDLQQRANDEWSPQKYGRGGVSSDGRGGYHWGR